MLNSMWFKQRDYRESLFVSLRISISFFKAEIDRKGYHGYGEPIWSCIIKYKPWQKQIRHQ